MLYSHSEIYCWNLAKVASVDESDVDKSEGDTILHYQIYILFLKLTDIGL